MNGIKGRLGYLGALTMVCGRATSRAFTSQAVQLNSHEFRRASSRRIYIGPFTEAILLPLFPPCATRRGLGIWATPALSLVLMDVCVCRRRLWRGLNEWYCGAFPIPSLFSLNGCPILIGTHTAPLSFRLGHRCDSVRLSICIQRSTPIAPQTRPRLNGTNSPQGRGGLLKPLSGLTLLGLSVVFPLPTESGPRNWQEHATGLDRHLDT